MQPLWDFLANNKDAIELTLKVLGFLGISSITGALWWLMQQWRKSRLRFDLEVFDVIEDPKLLLPKLFFTENDDGLLADHQITYQQRDPNYDLKTELRKKLRRSRYLLITAPSGYGKTREAGELIKIMMQEEDWRVLRIKTGWLDTPKELPKELGGTRYRIIILLDDLNGLFRSKEDQSTRAGEMFLLKEKSYHDRLLDVLDWFEKRCGETEIRVVATARSELDEWNILNYHDNDKLWKRFTRVELGEPKVEGVIEILKETINENNLRGNSNDFEAIARKNDGSYRNIILNLKKSQATNYEITKENFTDTQDGSWREQYERILFTRPAIQYIYNAIDIARQSHISLSVYIIEPLATILWDGNFVQKWIRRRRINKTIHFITDQKKFLPKYGFELAPRDGQIEAKREIVSWIDVMESLAILLLDLAKNNSKNKPINDSLLSLATACHYQGENELATRLMKKYIDLNQSDADITAPYNYQILLENLNIVGGRPLSN